LHIFETWRGRQLLQAGRLPDAAAILEGQFGLEAPDNQQSVLDVAGVVALGRVAIHTGDARLKRLTAEFARGSVDEGPPSFRRQAAWLLALQALAAGDAPAARAWLCAFGEDQRTAVLPLFPVEVTDDVQLVRIAIAAGDHELGTSAVTAAESRAASNPGVPTIGATAVHARGLLTGDTELLGRAVELLDGGPRPLALAAALEDLGVARVAGASTEAGIEALGRALTLYTQTGAAWDAGRVRSRLRDHGVRRRVVAQEREETGWAAMTDSELAVARLVAHGLTNREVAEQLFVSSHTVSSHLRRVFAKLDINSRVELTRLASETDRASMR
jgi:DNA-binding CsgD family transcriptional regulator